MPRSRSPIVTTLVLFIVITLIYTIAGSSNSLGDGPINLAKDDLKFTQQSPEFGKGYSDESILESNKEISTDEHEDEVGVKANAKVNEILNDDSSKKIDATGKDNKKEFGSNKQQANDLGTEEAFMPKMANETLKAQLGNAAWRLFHTILARYPDKPTSNQQTTLSTYIETFAQVYPCGDCARHFQKLLAKYPPQTGSRKTAALWGCHIHNKVNERLNKPEYDCTTILEDYDCGCGNDENEIDITLGGKTINNLKDVKVEEEEQQLG